MLSTARRFLRSRAPIAICRRSRDFTDRSICADADSQLDDKFQSLRDVRPACARLRVAAETYRYQIQRANDSVWTRHAPELRDLRAQSIECELLAFREWERLAQLTIRLKKTRCEKNVQRVCRSFDCAEDMGEV